MKAKFWRLEALVVVAKSVRVVLPLGQVSGLKEVNSTLELVASLLLLLEVVSRDETEAAVLAASSIFNGGEMERNENFGVAKRTLAWT